MAKILLIDVDSVMPNLALMKLSAYHKTLGDEVYLAGHKIMSVANYLTQPDKVYASIVFSHNYNEGLKLKQAYPKAEIGGTGWDLMKTLPDEIEHIKPDYDLYTDIRDDYLNFSGTGAKALAQPASMGFTTRGCCRNCPFCLVVQKEGNKIIPWSDVDEFYDERFDKIILLDNNFLGAPTSHWCKVLKRFIELKVKIDFCQGLDIRFMTNEKAQLLSHIRFDAGRGRQLRFAWDSMAVEPFVDRGIKMLFEAGLKPINLFFYILVGFDTTFEEDKYRAEKLIKLGASPFLMLYRNPTSKVREQHDPIKRAYTAYINRRKYTFVKFENSREYQRALNIKEIRRLI